MVRLFDGCALWAFLSAPSNKWTTTTRITTTTTIRMSSTEEPCTQRDLAQQENKDVLWRSAAISSLLWQHNIKAAQAAVSAASNTIVKGSASGGLLDLVEARRVIESGQTFSVENFLEPALVEALREEIKQYAADNKFKPSGLSNFAKASPGQKDKQGFGKNDRGAAPVTFSDPANSEVMVRVGDLVDEVRLGLARVMNRPTMADITLGHESYFSRSLEGASLARHMDEHHEETKGRRGWTTSSRRSVSWLLYLSDFEWDVASNGGALRAFPQSLPVIGACGADEGNLQIGWWKVQVNNANGAITPTAAASVNDYNAVQPVFLDCWRRQYVNGKATSVARAALYVQDMQSGRKSRKYLTVDFDTRDPGTGAALDSYDAYFKPDVAAIATAVDTTDGTAASATATVTATASVTQRFLKTEDMPAWQEGRQPAGSKEQITSPRGGTLVLFDSVALPHDVMTTLRGERLALAGWLHERQQQFPSWYV